MSQSPRESEEVEPAPASLNEDEPQDHDPADLSDPATSTAVNITASTTKQDTNDPNMSRGPDDIGYDFEVKEQDRWLPIANGESFLTTVTSNNHYSHYHHPCRYIHICILRTCFNLHTSTHHSTITITPDYTPGSTLWEGTGTGNTTQQQSSPSQLMHTLHGSLLYNHDCHAPLHTRPAFRL